ncbi:unnamed protein product [Blepharisma stoltei]|uniref:Casein kinase I n=1 Tax=Blepharisma stoltei TaxID=1481888 RepID=A0AAU9IC06_9CILI|nr:unnamed protein product [Blepharisma stoltei]
MMPNLIGNRFQVISSAGEGQFGRVFLCTDLETQTQCAVKIPSVSSKDSAAQLINEGKILKAIQGGKGIPKLIKFSSKENQEFLAIQYLGLDLETKFAKHHKIFSLATILTIAEQLVDRLEYIHRKGYIHRDLKPRQLLLGLDSDVSTLYVVDYGLSKLYMQRPMGLHIPYIEGRPFEGTPYFASLNTHIGIQQSRRDDLEGVVYMLAYFLNGSLPWIPSNRSIKINEKQIRSMKSKISSTELFANKPEEFSHIFKYARNLEFDAEPDYQYIKNQLALIRQKNNIHAIGFEFKTLRKRNSSKNSSLKPPRPSKIPLTFHSFLIEDEEDNSRGSRKCRSTYDASPITPSRNWENSLLIDDDLTVCLNSHPEIKDRSILVRSPRFKNEILTECGRSPTFRKGVVENLDKDKKNCVIF